MGENTINMNRSQLREMVDLCVKTVLKEGYGDNDYAVMERAKEIIEEAFDYGYIEEGDEWEEILRVNSYIDESAQSLSEEFDINIDEALNYLQKAFNNYENMYEGKNMKQVTISESKLRGMIKESTKKMLREWGVEDLALTYEGTPEEFEKCYEDLDLYVENMSKSYSIETITEVLRRLTKFYEDNEI